jgi:hypothetical protein
MYPGIAPLINLPPHPPHRVAKRVRDPLSPECRLEEALADVAQIRAIWKRHYDHTNRPSGTLTAEEVAAERWGLDEDDVRKRRVSPRTRERLAHDVVKVFQRSPPTS